MKHKILATGTSGAALILSLAAQPATGAVVLSGTSNLGTSGANYTNASSIPVSSTDLINGLSPTSRTPGQPAEPAL